MQNTNPLIFLTDKPISQKYTPRGSGNSDSKTPFRNIKTHGQKLISQLTDVFDKLSLNNEERIAVGKLANNGFYLEFNSSPAFDLAIKSLDSKKEDGIKLLNNRKNPDTGITSATVFVPFSEKKLFFNKIEEYNKDIDNLDTKAKPKNAPLINSIDEIKEALVKSFWQSQIELLPNEDAIWCEIWLRVEEGADSDHIDLVINSFYKSCDDNNIQIQTGKYIRFPNRLIFLACVNYRQLQELIYSNDFIAEFRIYQEPNFWMSLSPSEQVEYVSELRERLVYNDSNLTICILDRGINNGHILIEPFLKDNDRHTYDPSWGVDDENGHGTSMAGLSLFGDLHDILSNNQPIIINHSLESVKILSSSPNKVELYGLITSQCISIAEIEAPKKKRIIVMALTSPLDLNSGQPSSWSASVDQIAFDSINFEYGSIKRLIFISAGNVSEAEIKSYPDSSILNEVESPGQSWNALTIGAYTNKYTSIPNYQPVASAGNLSPFSKTSVLWNKEWPIKPEVLFEGGNAFQDTDDDNFYSRHNDLSLLTTYYKPIDRQFDTFCMTSASTALAGRFAAQIMSLYPDSWEETIRGLIVHSATWSEVMKKQFLNSSNRNGYSQLLRTCGYGIPNLQKAINCLNNSFTLVIQEKIQPFTDRNNKIATNEMHIYELPWPKDILLSLGAMPVTLKVTLSYFIDPNPSESGYKSKYRYASHGLRFDINLPNEKRDVFIANINAAIKSDEENSPNNKKPARSERWLIGSSNRDVGSIHSDSWKGTAADLSVCNYIAVYPIIGWWRERPKFKKVNMRTRYSLIISLETEDQTIPIYETVSTIIKNRVKVEIST